MQPIKAVPVPEPSAPPPEAVVVAPVDPLAQHFASQQANEAVKAISWCMIASFPSTDAVPSIL